MLNYELVFWQAKKPKGFSEIVIILPDKLYGLGSMLVCEKPPLEKELACLRHGEEVFFLIWLMNEKQPKANSLTLKKN